MKGWVPGLEGRILGNCTEGTVSVVREGNPGHMGMVVIKLVYILRGRCVSSPLMLLFS